MKKQEIAMYILGGFIVAGFFALLGMLIYNPAPSENSNLLNIVIGALIGAFMTVVGYYYGSSKGSADKNDLIRKNTDPEPPTPPIKP